jgi:predicted kinase
MAVLHLICGLPSSGKTTLGRHLESQLTALRLDPDEWTIRLMGEAFDVDKHAIVKVIQVGVAMRALSLGLNVVLEHGFWFRAERMEVRSQAASVGAVSQLHFLDVPLEELICRASLRNEALPPNTYKITGDQLRLWSTWFERPSEDELQQQ